MKYISEADLRANLINDGCDDGCGYLDERDISSLPWIEVNDDEKQKFGHWIDIDEKSAVCSCCNRNNTLYGNFCKWCGARMVEQESEG